MRPRVGGVSNKPLRAVTGRKSGLLNVSIAEITDGSTLALILRAPRNG